MTHPFHSIHTHGFLRVGACTPPGHVGDPAAGARAAIALARQGHEAGANLLVFPELNLTAYAIDDLHLQDALCDATEAALAAVVAASAELRPVLLLGAALRRNGRLYNCAVAVARGRVLGVVPKTYLPNYREYYEKRWFAPGVGLTGLTMTVAGREVPFGTDLIFAAHDMADFVFHAEICEDFWSPLPPPPPARWPGRWCSATFRRRTSSSARPATARCCARRNPRGPCPPMSIRRRAAARARPTCPGMDRDRCMNWARCWYSRSGSIGRRGLRWPISISTGCGWNGCGRARSTIAPPPAVIPKRASAGSGSTMRPRRAISACCGRCGAIPSSPTRPNGWTTTATRRSTSRSRPCASGWSRRGRSGW